MTDFRALCAELVAALKEWTEYEQPCTKEDDTDLAQARRLVQRAYALLAQPEPQGPTDEEINDWHGRCADLSRLGEADHYWAFDLRHDEVAGVVRAVLARWGRPAIEPVPVAERLPGPEDCDAEGRCWFYTPSSHVMNANWVYRKAEHRRSWDTHWAPHWALPVPATVNTINQED